MTVLRPQLASIPLPAPSAASRPFWDGCAQGQLLFQRCGQCHAPAFDPVLMCRSCGAQDLQWEASAGLGAVYSWATVWRPQTPAFSVPYVAAIIDLDEGYQMVTNIIGGDEADVHVGLRVAVEFHDVGEGFKLPYFRATPPT